VVRIAADVGDDRDDLVVRPVIGEFCLAWAPGAVPVAATSGLRVAVEYVPFPIWRDVDVPLCGPVRLTADLMPAAVTPAQAVGMVVVRRRVPVGHLVEALPQVITHMLR
jgi:hypothetical protein